MNRVEKMISERNKMIYDLLNENSESIALTNGRVKPTYKSVAVNCSFGRFETHLPAESKNQYPERPKKSN